LLLGIVEWKDLFLKRRHIFENNEASGDYISGTATFWSRTDLIPPTAIFERLKGGWQIVFTGFSQGGAAAAATLL